MCVCGYMRVCVDACIFVLVCARLCACGCMHECVHACTRVRFGLADVCGVCVLCCSLTMTCVACWLRVLRGLVGLCPGPSRMTSGPACERTTNTANRWSDRLDEGSVCTRCVASQATPALPSHNLCVCVRTGCLGGGRWSVDRRCGGRWSSGCGRVVSRHRRHTTLVARARVQVSVWRRAHLAQRHVEGVYASKHHC